MSTDAQKYCQLDVDAVLLLYTIFSNLPDLTMRLSRDLIPPVGSIVDIMPECGTSVTPIAQGVIREMGPGTWSTNGIRLTKKQVVLVVNKIFDIRGIIHYPCDEQKTETMQLWSL